jgi:hypothetical protein
MGGTARLYRVSNDRTYQYSGEPKFLACSLQPELYSNVINVEFQK